MDTIEFSTFHLIIRTKELFVFASPHSVLVSLLSKNVILDISII